MSNYGVGYDNIDVPACAARGVAVGNTPGALTETTADFTWTLLLAAARRLAEGAAYVRAGDWTTWGPQLLLGSDVYGSTLGIVGFGRIGQAVARRAAGFGMTVLYSSRTAAPAAVEASLGAHWVELDELLARSDIVTLHCPLNDETRGLIGAAALARMKPTAVLVNTARGPVVDQAALAAALRDGVIAGAALDVTDPEPIDPGDPLLRSRTASSCRTWRRPRWPRAAAWPRWPPRTSWPAWPAARSRRRCCPGRCRPSARGGPRAASSPSGGRRPIEKTHRPASARFPLAADEPDGRRPTHETHRPATARIPVLQRSPGAPQEPIDRSRPEFVAFGCAPAVDRSSPWDAGRRTGCCPGRREAAQPPLDRDPDRPCGTLSGGPVAQR